MRRSKPLLVLAAAATITVLGIPSATAAPSARPIADDIAGGALADRKLVELSETTRLADRRSLVTGERVIAMGDETGLFPAAGFHTRGEMGGIWSPPVKLLDGIWFAVDDAWLGTDVAAAKYTSGWGYQRFDYAGANGLSVGRLDFAPEGARANVIGLTLRSDTTRTVKLAMDAHSELMSTYPWGGTTPSQSDVNLPDSGSFDKGALNFRDKGTSPGGVGPHDYAAVVGSSARPSGHELGPDHRGPQDPAVVCPADGAAPARCDDTAFGKGTGGQLSYDLELRAGKATTVWFTVAGSDRGPAAARAEFARASKNPMAALKSKVDGRMKLAGHTRVDLPGDRLLQQSIDWSKQNLADSVQEPRNLSLRDVDEGKAYPAAVGSLDKVSFLGAGFPDYPWMFGTDGEYTAFASVAAGQFEPIKAHLRSLRDVSEIVNERSGKVVHEVLHTGDVYFGTNVDAGNTDETVKFPSAVALLWRWTGDDRFRDDLYDFSVRNLRYAAENLDEDGDGWLEGLGNVERPGMGEEKLDSTAYFIRGLLDLADMAASKGDADTEAWASGKAADLRSRFEQTWRAPGDANAYAESIDDPADPSNDNTPIFQRHWTGVSPMEIELPDGSPLADGDFGPTALAQREKPCYTGEFGLFHTGSGPTSDPAGNPGPACDTQVSSVKSERSTFTLNTGVMAVGEGNFGRLDAQRTYTTGNARVQLDPTVWETPGAMPEITPSPDFVPNIDRPFNERSMTLQAWGAYGTLWPVVHHQLGVYPDLGNGRLSVVSQLPAGQDRISGSDILLGKGSADVKVWRTGRGVATSVDLDRLRTDLTVGAVLPADARPSKVTFNGHEVDFDVVRTTRGTEVRAAVDEDGTLEVSFR